MDPREESFEEDLGSLLGRLAELSPPPPDAARVGMALRRRSLKRKVLGGAAVVVVGAIVTVWALHGAGPAAPLPPVIQAATPEQPVQPRPGHDEMPTLSFLSVAMPTFETGQGFKFETGPVSIPAVVKSEGPQLAVTYRVPSVSMPRL